MKLLLAKSAGFCFGVSRAVNLARESAAAGKDCVMLGPVIHNAHVVEDLKGRGVGLAFSPEELPDGKTVVIRSHGEARRVYEYLEKRGLSYIDSTCPNVSRIHRLVAEAEAAGRRPLIVGNPLHPEIVAVAGWCDNPLIVENPEEIARWLAEAEENRDTPLTVVCQTTCTAEQWNSCVDFIKKECTNLQIFDTICSATYRRQSEAAALASECDAMVIIGDGKSSNTRRLAEICRARCGRVFLIEDASMLPLSALAGASVVGITAGASTPAWIIKEVCDKMSDEINVNEESFAELLEKSFKTLNTGEKVTGIVTGITPTEIHVDLGAKQAGYIPVSELSDDPDVKVDDLIKVGDTVETYVMRVNDVEGVVTLSKKRLDTVKSWEDVEAAREDRRTMEGIVKEENKGGVVVSVKGVRVFIPASQTGLPKDVPMTSLVGTRVKLRITEVNRSRRRVVGSIRAVQFEERQAMAEKIWSDIEVDKHYTGKVKSLTSYGAFVDIGGVDGMVHISELTWSRIKQPSEAVSVGQVLDVYVIAVDKEKKKISLGVKNREENPWAVFTKTYSVGSVLPVKVVKLMPFGAFAEILPGVDGLIHISQIANRRIDKPGDVLSEGQTVNVKIIDVDPDKHKVSLSIRALLEAAAAAEEEELRENLGQPDPIVASSGETPAEPAE